MVTTYDPRNISKPNTYLITMLIFLVIVGLLAMVFLRQISGMFMANPALNSLILFVLFIGLVLSFRDIIKLYPEISWVSSFRRGAPQTDDARDPKMLAPLADLLTKKDANTPITIGSMRGILETIGMRLDEQRDTARYLIGLLVFLGLLGTFWGLLGTVDAVGNTIRSLDVVSGDTKLIFEDLKTGLEAPLSGMGTAFSSSLFGLSGSLILGFLDLRSGHAQNKFYNDLEEWLTSFAQLDGMPDLKVDATPGNEMRASMERLAITVHQSGREGVQTGTQTNTEIANLSARIENLVHQMRSEQQLVRNWMEAQSDQQAEIRDFLAKLAKNSGSSKNDRNE